MYPARKYNVLWRCAENFAQRAARGRPVWHRGTRFFGGQFRHALPAVGGYERDVRCFQDGSNAIATFFESVCPLDFRQQAPCPLLRQDLDESRYSPPP
ncbi:MAG: hypothetical protein AAB654_00385 [Acidobacteriota bacterium]